MQIIIISLPPGEQIANLTVNVDTSEAVIGQSHHCQIRLPDQHQDVEDRHARLFCEDSQWYLENLSSTSLSINYQELPPGTGQHVLLSDGDIIACGGYRLMFDNFSPWLTQPMSHEPSPSQEEISSLAVPASSDLRIGNKTGGLNDPFDKADAEKEKHLAHDDAALPALFDGYQPFMQTPSPPTNSASGLIDVLAHESDEEDGWVINRHLWLQGDNVTEDAQQYSKPVITLNAPQLNASELNEVNGGESEQSDTRAQNAMMYALESVLENLAPDVLIQSLEDRPGSLMSKGCFLFQRASSKSLASRYWKYYQVVYRDLMHDKKYRLRFIEYFQEAMSKQEL